MDQADEAQRFEEAERAAALARFRAARAAAPAPGREGATCITCDRPLTAWDLRELPTANTCRSCRDAARRLPRGEAA